MTPPGMRGGMIVEEGKAVKKTEEGEGVKGRSFER
jgi:hypothetical protein